MPTKGPSRPHQAIRLTPAAAYASSWGAGGVAIGPDRVPHRVALGGEDPIEVTIDDVDALRRRAREEGAAGVPVSATLPDGTSVDLAAVVHDPNGLRYEVSATQVRCSAHPEAFQCAHGEPAIAAVRALVEGGRLPSMPEEWERHTASVAETLATAHAEAEAARAALVTRVPDGPAWTTSPEAFQAAYDAARVRQARGDAAIPHFTENATGGLGARDGGRAFGCELEFDFEPGVDRAGALAAIGGDLYAAGLTDVAHQRGYHATRDFSRWRFETDATVAGEVISPILYDEPQSWAQLAQACEIIRRHGGRATARTGGHVHVGAGDFDHTVENHNSLLGAFGQWEDVYYRLSQNPARRAHRGLAWCRPNRIPAEGYQSIHQVQAQHSSHGVGLNFGSVNGNVTDHVEFRMWDGSLDPAVIQTQIKLSLALTDAAARTPRGTIWGREPIGLHRQRNAGLGSGARLAGEEWREDTASFRRLVDRLFCRQVDREQAAALFAVTRWQRGQ